MVERAEGEQGHVGPAGSGRDLVVEHEAAEQGEEERLVVREGAAVAELVYHRDGDRLSILHTGVPPPLEGRGVGSALVRAAVGLAEAGSLTVVPSCPFARRWLENHADEAAAVEIDWS